VRRLWARNPQSPSIYALMTSNHTGLIAALIHLPHSSYLKYLSRLLTAFTMGVHHLLTGSYSNSSLYLLAFDTIAKTLTLNSTVPGFGLHQFLNTNAARDVIYGTAMSEPPRVFAWSRTKENVITHINTVNISEYCVRLNICGWLTSSATSSCYISDNGNYAFSAGGSGARINALDEDGGIGEMTQEMLYVPKEEMDVVDKTRTAVVRLPEPPRYYWSQV
jgi:carboxy-cis,cis-muconate cyclase